MKDSYVHPVIITRPARQAQTLARRVAQAGRQAVVFPLLEIWPLPDRTELRAALNRLTDYALVVFVSPNAIDAVFALHSDWPAQVDIGVVGEGSKAALARHGLTGANPRIFSPADRERSDSQGLLEALDIDSLRGRRVLIVRGESGRELLADTLRAKGVTVEPVAAYRRIAPPLDQSRRAQLQALLDSAGDWIITSSEALRILVDQVRSVAGDAGVAKLQQQHLVVPHIRIQETAQSHGFVRITRTGSGDDQLLAKLQFPA